MLEFPEVMARAAQLEKEVAGKKVTAVLPPNKSHKFCWFNGAPICMKSGSKTEE